MCDLARNISIFGETIRNPHEHVVTRAVCALRDKRMSVLGSGLNLDMTLYLGSRSSHLENLQTHHLPPLLLILS